MSSTEPLTEDKTLVEWKFIDITFKGGVNDALFAAIEPPEDVLAQRSPADLERNEDTLISRLRAWGWGTAIEGGELHRIGCYYDYTTIEDDERFMPLIAPFVRAGSIAVYELKEGPWVAMGWKFDGTSVTRGTAESHTEWFVA